MARKKTVTPQIENEAVEEKVTPVEIQVEEATPVEEKPVEQTNPVEEKPAKQTKAEKRVELSVLLNIRKGPSKSTPIVTIKPAGTILPVKEILPTGWIRTELDGEECFVLYDGGKYGTVIE